MSKSLSRRAIRQLSAGDRALYIVLQAIRQQRRGRGRKPAVTSRDHPNPRICLQAALRQLGLSNLDEARRWLGQERSLTSGSYPDAMIGSDGQTAFVSEWPALTLLSPRRRGHFLYLFRMAQNPFPLLVGVYDADGQHLRLPLRLNHLLPSTDPFTIMARGELRSEAGVKVRTLDGKLRALFPRQSIQVRVCASQGVYLLELLDVLA